MHAGKGFTKGLTTLRVGLCRRRSAWIFLALALAPLLAGSVAGQQKGRSSPSKPAPQPAKTQGEALSEQELKELEGVVDQQVQVGPQVFDEGVQLYYDGKYVAAAGRLWDYLASNQPGAEKYGYAEYFMALSFDHLGLTHAAMEYYFNVAKNRTQPELLPDALDALERISRDHPFDQELILRDLIYDTTFGYLRPDLREFVEYYQGLLDHRNGFIRWGTRHFARLGKKSYYYYKGRYVQAVYELVKYNLDKALEIFQEILSSDIDQTDVINNARQSVARILFEQKRYLESYEMYERINAPVEKQASVFLEEAWCQYYLKDYQRAMGLLYALEAPAFYGYFNPEKYLLKALIYKNLCHYNVAKDAVAEFFHQYGEAVQAVYDRVDLEKNEVLREAALQEPALIELSDFQRLLEFEIEALTNYESAWAGNGLLRHLVRIYELKIEAVNLQLKKNLDDSIRRVAEKLLEFEEQMNLLEYEIGLSIYKRIKGTPTQKEVEQDKIPYSDPRAYFEFDGEFWNDEMHDFRFFIEDRCFAEERWE